MKWVDPADLKEDRKKSKEELIRELIILRNKYSQQEQTIAKYERLLNYKNAPDAVFEDLEAQKKAVEALKTELQEHEGEINTFNEELQIQNEELETQNEEIRRRNAELEKAKNDLRETESQAELYLDLMGHDISNMHQIMMMQLELAKETLNTEGKLEAGDNEFIEIPYKTLKRAAVLIDTVRKLQKVQAGDTHKEAVDLDDVLFKVVNEYKDAAGGRITINDGGRPHRIMANELLYDVFANLVGNAVKHSNGAGANISVNLEAIRDNSKLYYKVSVEDKGPGIKDEMKEKIFNRLQCSDTNARGMGLGLYLVKTLVGSYHGRVWVEDRVKDDHTKGARFVVMLPAIDT